MDVRFVDEMKVFFIFNVYDYHGILAGVLWEYVREAGDFNGTDYAVVFFFF